LYPPYLGALGVFAVPFHSARSALSAVKVRLMGGDVKRPKIVLIGAASVIFGPVTLRDLLLSPTLAGSEIALVDVAEKGLDDVLRFGERLNATLGRGCSLSATTDRKAALRSADFVIVSVAVDRERTWKLDFEIPLRLGVRHVLGENGGPGGLSHSLRNIPLLLEIAHDVETLAPKAWIINFTNPMSRLCMALARLSRVPFVGLCHQVHEGYRIVAEVLGLEPRDLKILAAGLNHFTWILAMTRANTGEDLYPEFRRRVAQMPPDFEPLSRELFDTFGLFPAVGDQHAGEYIGDAWRHVSTTGYDWDWYHRRTAEVNGEVQAIIRGEEDVVRRWLATPSIERAQQVIAGLWTGDDHVEEAVNVVNNGAIANLPPGAIVEVPARISRNRVMPLQVEPLPKGIAELCARQVAIQELTLQAAVSGNRNAALQALVLDPVVPDTATARRVLEELLGTHAAYLPQFA
jgi:alpha-galactosidase